MLCGSGPLFLGFLFFFLFDFSKFVDDHHVSDHADSLHEAVSDALVGNFVHFLLSHEQFLLENVGDLADEVLFNVAFVVVKHLFKRKELVVADVR